MATALKRTVREAKNIETQLREKHQERTEVTCFKCGKARNYATEWTLNKKACYECNEEGHILRDCPKKLLPTRPNVPPRPKSRAFQMKLEAAKDATNVTSANYSFISHKFSGRLALSIDKLDNALVVEVSSGKFIPVSDCIKNIVIDLNGNEFHEELLPIQLNGFDVVLEMDWLSTIEAKILCRKKIIRVNSPGK
ncbi:uncharacterized protein LOC111917027 [Lactuca sativa]|uniref:uncharacterized protein LOC111917027 n=1 Tax=Lactuca sativa TaxID=4236 RepID=UPI000CD9E591|nr:uncharacterized protein LOC111917027 [Lactuca sativa]